MTKYRPPTAKELYKQEQDRKDMISRYGDDIWGYDGAYQDSKIGYTAAGAVSKTIMDAYKACHESHKAVGVLNGLLRGGSCRSPLSDYDVYVGLDFSFRRTHELYPWQVAKAGVPEHQFEFLITDGRAPKDPALFKEMVTWLVGQLFAGKKVHVGCIGGHGRTGLVMAAVVAEATGNKDAITWVREHHCKKAVESEEQVDFLVEHYGVAEVEPSKVYSPVGVSTKIGNVVTVPPRKKGSYKTDVNIVAVSMPGGLWLDKAKSVWYSDY